MNIFLRIIFLIFFSLSLDLSATQSENVTESMQLPFSVMDKVSMYNLSWELKKQVGIAESDMVNSVSILVEMFRPEYKDGRGLKKKFEEILEKMKVDLFNYEHYVKKMIKKLDEFIDLQVEDIYEATEYDENDKLLDELIKLNKNVLPQKLSKLKEVLEKVHQTYNQAKEINTATTQSIANKLEPILKKYGML